MTNTEFSALAQILRLRTGPTREAARLALVQQLTPAQAARITGLTYARAWKSINRAKRGLQLAKIAAG